MTTISLFALALLLAVTCTGCGGQQEASYADLIAAERAGAIRQGWIPDWVPKSARDLREVHNIDTNQSMLSFRSEQGGLPQDVASWHSYNRG